MAKTANRNRQEVTATDAKKGRRRLSRSGGSGEMFQLVPLLGFARQPIDPGDRPDQPKR